MSQTKEPQYQVVFDSMRSHGLAQMGPVASHLWRSDPRHLVFFLSRYKFVAKMLHGKARVLEVGCGDAFGSTLLTQGGAHVHCTDFDAMFIDEAKARENGSPSKSFAVMDFTCDKTSEQFDAAYSLDVIEHIAQEKESDFIRNISSSIKPSGTVIIGTPSLESQTHASIWSKAGHINCKSGESWRQTFSSYFENVFLFSMNDEVVHTGFSPMAHYLFILATHPIPRK